MALAKRYVDASAAGGGDGTTAATSGVNGAFTWAEMITDLNTPRAGYKYLVKSGTYANTTTATTLTGDGTTTSPNVIEGYNTTEGDLYAQARTSAGVLDTTNFPVISYTGATARFIGSGANYLNVACLTITSAASNWTVHLGAGACADHCDASNTGTNAASYAIGGSASDITITNCDVSVATTGATAAINLTGNNWLVDGCRAKCVAGAGIKVVAAGVLKNNTVFECTTGIAVDATTATPFIINNTIVNCTGDGIDIVTATTAVQTIKSNSITGCGGYAIDFNISTCAKRLGNNRFRDNTSGTINGGGDWEEGTSNSNVTTDDTDAIDFVDATTDNYSLLAGAPQTSKGDGYLIDIGAHGSPVVTGGGAFINTRRNTLIGR